MASIIIGKNVAKDITEKAGLLGKDARLYMQVMPKSQDGKAGLMYTIVNQPNQYTFGATIDEPEDFVQGKSYMKFACDASRFVNIVNNLLLFDGDIGIAMNNGRVYIAEKSSESMISLDTIAWPVDESAVFFDAKGEDIVAAIKSVDVKEFVTALMIGGGFDGENDMTRGVSISFTKDNLVVSSTTGAVAATAHSDKIKDVAMGTEPTRVCVSDRQLDALRRYVSMCNGEFSIQCGKKHIFIYSKNGNLFLGLSIPGADADGCVAGFTEGNYVGTVVFDTEQLSTVLKAYSGVTEEEVALFSLNGTKLSLKARKSKVMVNAPIASKDGDLSSFPQCMSIKLLRSALNVLKNGNLVITLYEKVKEDKEKKQSVVVPILSNEKVNGAYNGEILLFPVMLDKLEASEKAIANAEAKKKAKKEEKAEEKKDTTEE